MTAGMYNSSSNALSGSLSAHLPGGVMSRKTKEELNTLSDSTVTVNEETHGGRINVLSRAAGIAVRLPASSGSGLVFRFFVGTTVTSNTTTIKVANASDTLVGTAINAQDGGNTAIMFEAGGTDDTITFDGSTTGGIKGDYVELIDVAANLWFVTVRGSATGTEATPFSATVS